MTRQPPPAVKALGLVSFLAGLGLLVWLVLGRQGQALDLAQTALGQKDAAVRLGQAKLASSGPIMTLVLVLVLEMTLALILIVAGLGLLTYRRSARWSALFFCVCAPVLEGGSTVLQLFYLTPSSEPVKLIPIIVNGLVILFAIVLWGGLFTPAVMLAYSCESVQTPEEPADETPEKNAVRSP